MKPVCFGKIDTYNTGYCCQCQLRNNCIKESSKEFLNILNQVSSQDKGLAADILKLRSRIIQTLDGATRKKALEMLRELAEMFNPAGGVNHARH